MENYFIVLPIYQMTHYLPTVLHKRQLTTNVLLREEDTTILFQATPTPLFIGLKEKNQGKISAE